MQSTHTLIKCEIWLKLSTATYTAPIKKGKEKIAHAIQCHAGKKEAGERNAAEGKFGEGKQTYSLGRIAARLKETSETSIYLAFLVMNLEKRLRVFLQPILIFWESTFSMSRIREKEY